MTQIEHTDRLIVATEMRNALADVMDVDHYQWDPNGALTLRGALRDSSQRLYRNIRQRVEELGYTPFLRRVGDQDELLARPGVMVSHSPRVWLPLLLFLLTFMTVTLTGALYEIHEPVIDEASVFRMMSETLSSPSRMAAGLPFTFTLLGILFTHEMGHYVVGRLRRAPVSLPYFIPIPPFISFTGTMGAVIVQREPMEDRRTILEIGIAGPIAGLIVAIPLLLYGLTISHVAAPTPEMLAAGYMQEGNSLLYAGAKYLVYGQWLPNGTLDVQLSSVAWGAWIGLLVTMLNLLPVGQLDGGHVAYALFGRGAQYLAYGMIIVCVALGLLVPDNYSWLVWAVLIVLIGPRHPAPLNDIAPLGWGHKLLAMFGLLLFVLLMMPSPLRSVGG